MSSVVVIADSGCDLPSATLSHYNIHLAPLIARFGMYELIDSPEARAEFWDKYDVSQPPQTSGPSVGTWVEVYQAALEQADEAVVVTLTGKHSGTFNSAMVAAAEFSGRVHVFDSWSLSLGEGLLVQRAAQLAASGESAATILEELTQWRQQLRVFIILDTMEAVQRGGRLAPLMAAIKRMSSILKIKPVLTLREGNLTFEGAVRSMKRGVSRLSNSVVDQPLAAVAVAHTRAPKLAEQLADQIAVVSAHPREAIRLMEAGPALAAHAGPGALGLAFVPAEPK